ncbi:hybrid sensor histidine kinase/response regulator [Syntrophotalea acetylenivorans]|uniref:histidine kinase n=1 Tax=Syntrophotalea acetylenivorans TaxID=1842532 RepID=A0A1L3GKM2_9BACT|nr:response regulator [Syntrophotalea acetylenivorans]APG26497.1 hybrid sensor histidine kinase/response regulator [Syntrophotalea acetylenivorans]
MSGRILVVDDETLILDLAVMLLTTRGYEVITAQNGEECLELVAQEKPPLVLLDYMMPGMDGMTTLQEMRKRFPDTYVIMLTGKGNEQIAVDVMKAGAADYILKPFSNQDLIDRIENVLRIRRIEIHNRELRVDRERLQGEIESWNRELERRVEEKSFELEQAHAEILQAEKLASLGHLVAGLAHEIRNPLNAISLFGQMLKPALAHDAEKVGYVDRLLGEVDRVDNILVKLLASSSRSRGTAEPVSLRQVIDGVLKNFSEQFETHNIELDKNLERGLPTITADPAEIELIFTNLFTNALYEMREGGKLGIRLARKQELIQIEVSDTGQGIPPQNLSKIFDPFFTTKTKGTGFGLSVVLRIVKTYNGHIKAQSEPGQGTVFQIEFPVV